MENYYKNHPWWWAGIFLSVGISATVATGKFLYLDPRDRDIVVLQKQLEEARSSPEIKRLRLQMQQIQSNRDEWLNHSKNLESKIATCDRNTMLITEISKLAAAKRKADHWVDIFLSPNINFGTEPSKANVLRSEEYRRQATQIQEQILGLQSKIAQ
ncbi:MAG: hypothetical protein GY941_24200 [Planctomycetes bacterium]|nr:hypothetical protein [Planctomycetota bacterium]